MSERFFGRKENPVKKRPVELELAKGTSGRRLTEPPSPEEAAAAAKASEEVAREKRERKEKEKLTEEKFASSRARWHEHLSRSAPSHSIGNKAERAAQELLRRKSEKK